MNTRTSVFRRTALLALSALAFAACDNKTDVVPVVRNTQVTITPSSASLQVGQTATFIASVSDDTTGANSGVTYTSTNPAVATVSAAGVVTAVAPGTTTIVATSKFNASRAAAAQVTVTAVVSNVTIAVVPTSATINAGSTLQLVPAVSGTTNTAVTYSTSDATVATVSTTGLVTALQKNGTAVITATSAADATKSASSVITVINGQITGVAAISITPTAATIDAGGTTTFTATVTGVANTAKTFSSTDTSVATVNATTGVATAKNKAGSTQIIATSTADPTKTAQATLTVTKAAVTVTVSPSTITLSPGSTQQITSSLTGSTADQAAGVTCVSASSAIASVTSPGCVITANASGTTTITVSSVADPSKTAQVTVTVANVVAPSLSIASVTTPAGTPIAAGSTVTGNIVVNMNVTTGTQSSIQRVAVRLNGVEACSQTFTPPLAPTGGQTPIQCTVNTAQLSSTTGTPVFPNGTYTLTADAFSTTNSVSPVATATFGTLVLNNANTVSGVVTYDNSLSDSDNTPAAAQAVDAVGNPWNGGTATVVVTPAIFSGTQAANVDIIMDLGCNGTADVTHTTAVAANGTATTTFSEAVNVAAGVGGNDDVENPTVCYEVGNARAANNTVVTLPAGNGTGGVSTVGTAVPTPVNAVDNVQPGTFAPTFSATFTGNNNFAGASTAFTSGSSAITGGTATDAGVGGITYSFFAVPAGTDVSSQSKMRTAVTGQTAVTSGSQLAGTATNSAYILIERAMDALGNTVYANVGTFGVDLVGPTLTTAAGSISTNATSTAANPGPQVINVSASDSISGVALFKARISGRKTNNTATTTLTCYDNTGAVVAAVSGVCPLVSIPATGGTTTATATVNIPAVDNFYTIDVVSVDRAGNTSAATITSNELRDTTVPTAAITSTTIAGSAVSVTGNVSDNVDLRGYDMRFRFAGLTTIPTDVPFTPLTVVDSYGLPLTGLVNGVTGSNNVAVRALTEGATLNTPTSFGFGVTDVAGNYGTAMQGYTAPAGGAAVANLNSFTIAANNTTICRTGTTAACGSATATATTSTTVTATINTPATAADPLQTIYFYYVHPGADNTIGTGDDYLVMFASVAAPVDPVQTGNTARIYSASATLAASTLPNTGTYRVVAIGATAAGDAVLSNVVGPITVN